MDPIKYEPQTSRTSYHLSDQYWQRQTIKYYLLWLLTLAVTAWEATAGREGFWWELASWLIPVLILATALVMGTTLIRLQM